MKLRFIVVSIRVALFGDGWSWHMPATSCHRFVSSAWAAGIYVLQDAREIYPGHYARMLLMVSPIGAKPDA